MLAREAIEYARNNQQHSGQQDIIHCQTIKFQYQLIQSSSGLLIMFNLFLRSFAYSICVRYVNSSG